MSKKFSRVEIQEVLDFAEAWRAADKFTRDAMLGLLSCRTNSDTRVVPYGVKSAMKEFGSFHTKIAQACFAYQRQFDKDSTKIDDLMRTQKGAAVKTATISGRVKGSISVEEVEALAFANGKPESAQERLNKMITAAHELLEIRWKAGYTLVTTPDQTDLILSADPEMTAIVKDNKKAEFLEGLVKKWKTTSTVHGTFDTTQVSTASTQLVCGGG